MTKTVIERGRRYKYVGGRKVEIDATRAIVQAMMQYQRQDEQFGRLFQAMYRYCDRLSEAHFRGELPTIILSFSSDDIIGSHKEDKRKGSFVSQDGLCLPYRVNLNVAQMKDGLDAAEVLTHEAVHAWQFSKGVWNSNNYHDEQWHEKMLEIGIKTQSRFGDTVGYLPRWQEWMEDCEDLGLSFFILPATSTDDVPEQLVFTRKEKEN